MLNSDTTGHTEAGRVTERQLCTVHFFNASPSEVLNAAPMPNLILVSKSVPL